MVILYINFQTHMEDSRHGHQDRLSYFISNPFSCNDHVPN